MGHDARARGEIAAWEARFAGQGYLFGEEPNQFLVRVADRLPAGGRVLCVADGEGRNGSWLAAQGFEVTAFDGSQVATEKAHVLDRARGVRVTRAVVDADGWDWETDAWDAIVAVFVQFAPPPMRERMFAGIRRGLRPGGILVIEGYTPRQLGFGTGGPPVAENMYTAALLRASFGDWTTHLLDEYDAVVDEGPAHSGMSALIDLVAERPADDPGDATTPL